MHCKFIGGLLIFACGASFAAETGIEEFNRALIQVEEHQHVMLPGGKPPFDGRGKMLLVLHRGADGKWRMRREMWNEGTGDSPSE